MSILAQQNIAEEPSYTFASADTPGGGQKNLKWRNNLGGQTRDRQEPHNYFRGYSYAPEDLRFQFGANSSATRTGPQGTPIANQGDSYGPPGFNRLSDSDEDPTTIPSLLTGFAYMMADSTDPGQWGEDSPAQRLKNTITSGDQMRSLWNSEVGVNGTPVASGGQFSGYQDNHRYGISNWNASETQVMDGSIRAATEEELQEAFENESDGETAMRALEESGVDERTTGKLETTRQKADITTTGIRVIKGMRGP